MKKRVWFLILPILLCGVVFWARDAAWNRVKADFRSDALAHIREIGIIVVEVAKSEKQDNFISYWQKPDFTQVVEKIQLMKAQPHSLRKNPSISPFEGGEWHG